VVDLSDCTFIDSTGLGILVEAERRIGRHALLVVAGGPEVLRAFEVSGLDRRSALHPTLESALNGGSAMSGWRDNEARDQALFRQVNERIEQLVDRFGASGRNQLICECGNRECTHEIELTAAECERVREHARRFVVALNYENPEMESIVEQNERFAVVEAYAARPHGSHVKPIRAHSTTCAQANVPLRGRRDTVLTGQEGVAMRRTGLGWRRLPRR
jgi:hypothetical protein